jgi:hypothetical protein
MLLGAEGEAHGFPAWRPQFSSGLRDSMSVTVVTSGHVVFSTAAPGDGAHPGEWRDASAGQGPDEGARCDR